MAQPTERPHRGLPRLETLELDDGTVVRYRRHENGGGRVALDATVHPSAYIAGTTWVDPGAVVQVGARIGPYGWVERHAVVGPGATLADGVRVGAGAVIGHGCRIGARVDLGTGSDVAAGSVLHEDTSVRPGVRVARSVRARGPHL